MFLSKLPKTKLANELFIILLVSLSMMVVSKLSKNNTRKKNINYEKIIKGLKGLKNVKKLKKLKSKKFSILMKGGENGLTQPLVNQQSGNQQSGNTINNNIKSKFYKFYKKFLEQFYKNFYKICPPSNNDNDINRCTKILLFFTSCVPNFLLFIPIYLALSYIWTENCSLHKLRDNIIIPFLIFWGLNTICIILYYEFKIMPDIDDEKDPVHWLKYAGLDKDHMPFDFMRNKHNPGISFLRWILFYPFQSLYYSIVTLSTIGFGDIYPIGLIPRLIFLLFVIKVVIGMLALNIGEVSECPEIIRNREQLAQAARDKLKSATKKINVLRGIKGITQSDINSPNGKV